jgi:hypothetical protein
MQIGNWATGYFTVAIAVHTCISLVFRIPQKAWVGPAVMVMGWLSALAVGKLVDVRVFSEHIISSCYDRRCPFKNGRFPERLDLWL